MEKTIKPSNEKKKRSKIVPYDYHYDLAMREKPISIAAIENLGEALIKWAVHDETARKLRPFFTKRGISSTDVERWSKRSKKFKRSYELAKCAIGDRREDGGLTKKYDPSIVLRSMAKYDKEWRELEQWRSDMKNSEKEREATIFNVGLPSFSTKKDEENDKNRKNGKIS